MNNETLIERIIGICRVAVIKSCWKILSLALGRTKKKIREDIYLQEKWVREPEYRRMKIKKAERN